MVVPVALVHVLDDLFAAVGLEVDVDVRRAPPLRREEALEDQVVGQRVDGRDAEQVGHQRIGRRAASLAQDALLAGEAHDVPHDQEVVGQPGLRDDLQLVGQLRLTASLPLG